MNPGISDKVSDLLEGCLQRDRQSQKMLYKYFFGYAMSSCLRYTANREVATEVLNDGFLKIFTKLHLYDPEKSLHGWIRRIMINTSIDHFRHYHKEVENNGQDLENALKVSAPEATVTLLSEVNFDTSIAPIIHTNCAVSGCHVAEGQSPELTSYEKVAAKAQKIMHETESLQMPPPSSGKSLSKEEIAMIACWIEQGTK